ncbi:hypothetical protein F5141DRAFT_128821 [Pisolithus sp. B1]|nr:hypothetical protein F5141DRAFT_128821 [Pisolithus sp. B1]
MSTYKPQTTHRRKSGEFDRLRRELLSQFQHSDRIAAFKSRVEDIARQRLASDPKLIHMPHDTIHRELMGEIDRYPIVERAVAEAPLLSEADFIANIHTSIQRILGEISVRENAGSADLTKEDGSETALQVKLALPNGDNVVEAQRR